MLFGPIKGDPKVFYNSDTGRHYIRYSAHLRKHGNYNLRDRLEAIGCTTVKENEFSIHVDLPAGWVELSIKGKENIIIDEAGRTRMVLHSKKEIEFTTKFAPIVHIIRTESEDGLGTVLHISVSISDGGREINSISYNAEEFQKLSEEIGTEKGAIAFLSETVIVQLKKEFPEWLDPLAYW